jgi:hypothetical protein
VTCEVCSAAGARKFDHLKFAARSVAQSRNVRAEFRFNVAFTLENCSDAGQQSDDGEVSTQISKRAGPQISYGFFHLYPMFRDAPNRPHRSATVYRRKTVER